MNSPLTQVRAADSLYVHVPFCTRRCDYCAFYTLARPTPRQRQDYLARLAGELAERAAGALPLRRLYLGGGTPSALAPRELAAFLALLHRCFRLADDCEFSVEANPDTSTPERIQLFRAAGVNRVSLGVQSFSAPIRAALGRHGPAAAVPLAVARWRAAGLPSLNLDLIYAVPGQSLADWEADLRAALALAPDHVSAYALMLKPGSRLARQGAREADDDTSADMWELAGECLGAAGLPRYEVSNYARPGQECRHNLDVWHGLPFLGAGPAACWFDGCRRWSNGENLAAWAAGAPPQEDALPPERRAAEILGTGLRTRAGWDRAEFRHRTGFDYLELRGPVLRQLAADGLLEIAPNHLRPRPHALLLADYLARELL